MPGRADIVDLSGLFRIAGLEGSRQGEDERPDQVAHRAVGPEDSVFIRGLFRQAGRVGKTPVDDAPGKVGTSMISTVKGKRRFPITSRD